MTLGIRSCLQELKLLHSFPYVLSVANFCHMPSNQSALHVCDIYGTRTNCYLFTTHQKIRANWLQRICGSSTDI